jgi:UDP-sugar transporter A1/2/3
LYQFKLITTAFFSVLILNRSLTRQQWGAIGILAVGVMIVQTSSSSPLSGSSEVEAKPISTKGMMAVGSACMLSGFAGVWFEMLLKQTGKHAASLWVRNVQLATFSLPLALGKLWLADRETVQELGFFSGYTSLVFLTIFMGSAGGLIVAVVVKYADNILKGFAASISAVVVTVISMLVPAFKFVPEPTFFVGGAVVFVAAYVYGTASTAAAAAATAKKLPTVTIREASVSPNPQ